MSTVGAVEAGNRDYYDDACKVLILNSDVFHRCENSMVDVLGTQEDGLRTPHDMSSCHMSERCVGSQNSPNFAVQSAVAVEQQKVAEPQVQPTDFRQKLFVKNLPKRMRPETILGHFERFGEVCKIDHAKLGVCAHKRSGSGFTCASQH